MQVNLDRSLFRFVTIHACDRQTDRRTEFSSLYRVCITCSAVKTTFFGLHFCRRKYPCIFNHFYAIRPECYRIRWN